MNGKMFLKESSNEQREEWRREREIREKEIERESKIEREGIKWADILHWKFKEIGTKWFIQPAKKDSLQLGDCNRLCQLNPHARGFPRLTTSNRMEITIVNINNRKEITVIIEIKI